MAVTYSLDNGLALHEAFPSTFEIPPAKERQSLKPGDQAKLIFRIVDGEKVTVERMWVKIKSVRDQEYSGVLDNDPYCTDEIQSGMPVCFEPDHIIQILRSDSR